MSNIDRLATWVARASRRNRARSALALVLNSVFENNWIGQQRFTTTADIDALHAVLQVGPGAHVLDIGSGAGGPAIYLAQQTGCRVTGIDAVPAQRAQAAAAAAALTHRVQFIAGDLFTARFPEDSFDAIIGRDAFVTVDDKAHLFRLCWRLLRPGGRMACTTIVSHGEPIDRPEDVTLLSWPLPTSADYHALALQGGLRILTIDDLTTTFREVSARWRGSMAVWEEELIAELGYPDFRMMQATIGQLAEWATQGRIG
ncbi:MAG: class I SAM-dependent methyltransferase, partial [Roseiflexaceae bacterium]